MKNTPEEIRAFLETIPDTFHIMKFEEIGSEIQKEYTTYSNSFGKGDLSEDETYGLGLMLLETQEDRAKKKALTLLAHLGTINAFREIERYYSFPETKLKDWAALAMHECKMNLESAASGYCGVFTPYGLGSVGNKFRLFVMLLSPTDTPFNQAQIAIIEQEFSLAAKELKCVIESAYPIENCAGLLVLLPHTVALDDLVNNGISRCNAHGNFVFEYYYAASGIPERDEIPEIIRTIREG